MVSIILVVIYVIIFIYSLYKYAIFRPKGFPPGPPRIPFFGSYLFLLAINYNYVHKASMIFSKLYKSDIIGFYLGDFPTVFVHNHNGIKEMLHNTDFNGRPDVFVGRLRDPDFQQRGITLNDGPVWKEQRRFMLRYLRDYGFGRRCENLEKIMNNELSDMIEILKNGPTHSGDEYLTEIIQKGRGLCPYFIGYYIYNSLLFVFCNEPVPHADRKAFAQVAKNGRKFYTHGDDYGTLLSITPWIHKLLPNLSGYNTLRNSSQHLIGHFNEIVEKYSKTFDESLEDRNFIDIYLREMKKAEKAGKLNTPFVHDEFIMGIFDFVFAATSTVPVQISFIFQWLMLRPDILKKIQNEIDATVNNGRLPSLNDRAKMPYTDAAIREGMRVSTILPSGLLHRALVDTELMGYKIPQGTLIAPGIHASHNDKEIWTDPEIYRPERLLNENGKLELKKDITLPFGAGKRLCAGETFARNFIFLFITSICQNFNIVLGENDKLPKMSKTLNGIVQSPSEYWLNLELRNTT